MKRKVLSILSVVVSVIMLVPTSAMADTINIGGITVDTDSPSVNESNNPSGFFAPTFDKYKNGSMTIDYKEDENTPVVGAEFTFYKVADFVDNAENPSASNMGTTVSTDLVSIVDGIKSFDSETDPLEIKDTVMNAYKSGTVDGETYKLVTGESGLGFVGNMEVGGYLGVETKPTEGYAESVPFVFTCPETVYAKEDARPDGWNYNLKICTKALPLSGLELKKTLSGNAVESGKYWNFIVNFYRSTANSNPNGVKRIHNTILPISFAYFTNDANVEDTYGTGYERLSDLISYTSSNGSNGKIKSGEKVSIRGGEKVTFSGIPIGTTYEIKEVEANKNGYTTEYNGTTGIIKPHTIAKSEVINTRNRIQTSDTIKMLYVVLALVSIATIILVIILSLVIRKRKNK